MRVKAIGAGLTMTALTERIRNAPRLLEKRHQRIPLNRAREIEDIACAAACNACAITFIACAAAFNACGDARYITSVNLSVVGGVTAPNG